jgi:hypothetical protein
MSVCLPNAPLPHIHLDIPVEDRLTPPQLHEHLTVLFASLARVQATLDWRSQTSPKPFDVVKAVNGLTPLLAIFSCSQDAAVSAGAWTVSRQSLVTHFLNPLGVILEVIEQCACVHRHELKQACRAAQQKILTTNVANYVRPRFISSFVLPHPSLSDSRVLHSLLAYVRYFGRACPAYNNVPSCIQRAMHVQTPRFGSVPIGLESGLDTAPHLPWITRVPPSIFLMYAWDHSLGRMVPEVTRNIHDHYLHPATATLGFQLFPYHPFFPSLNDGDDDDGGGGGGSEPGSLRRARAFFFDSRRQQLVVDTGLLIGNFQEEKMDRTNFASYCTANVE